jgi:tight adherence protein C
MSEATFTLLMNLIMLLALLAGLGALWMVRHGGTRGRIAERLRSVAAQHDRPGDDAASVTGDAVSSKAWLRRLAAIGERLPLFDARYRLNMQKELMRSGYRSARAVQVFLSIKFFFGLVCATVVVMFGSELPLGDHALFRGLAMFASFFLGMAVPEFVFKWLAGRRRAEMAQYLPDALDLLVICTNAGNSLGVSIRRVADELALICPPLSSEFSLTADELSLSGDSQRALFGLAERIDLPSIRALISTLTQSMRYGTPITGALRTLSRTERIAHVVSLEEKAAKLAPKMVLPMMMFILPPVVIIAAGPAVIQLLDFLASR